MATKTRTPTNDRYKHMYIGVCNGAKMYTDSKMGLDDYIRVSPIWETLREQRLLKDDYHCKRCGTPFNLQVHHVKYPDVWGEESINDLVTLCDTCHSSVHSINN